LRKILLVTIGCAVLALTSALLAGPMSSGALLLLLPAPYPEEEHDLPEDYEPLHKGGVDLSSGLYVRENEDLLVDGTPALILRRTYLSGYRVSKDFGIGSTHNGEEYLIGDPERFQWASLVTATGSRINFGRISRGTSVFNAMFEHRESPTDWQGARLGWTGIRWALRKADGSLSIFRACGPGIAGSCSILESRDGDGHTIRYRRDAEGRLLRMEAGQDRWIAFEYDDQRRITRAHTSASRDARYEYDARGRLTRVSAGDGAERRYTYTDRDELATIAEPGTSIENIWDANGRCIRQINRFDDGREPLIFDFTYHLNGKVVTRTDSVRSDGTWSRFTWNESRYSTSEARGHGGEEPAIFTYERDPDTNLVTSLTLTCPDRTGRPLRHTSVVRPDNEEWIKWDLVRTHCSWSPRSRGGRGQAIGGQAVHGEFGVRP
jgi:YD repeat-containing protein